MKASHIILFLIFCLLTPSLSAQSAGRENFDSGWKFRLGDLNGAESASFDDHTWRTLDLPHDWSIEGSFKPDNPATNAGAALPGGIGWYRKTFSVTDTKTKHQFIRFDGVYMNSTVWVNGHQLGNRPFGYSTFEYDMTPYLLEGSNVVAVKVDNSLQPNSRWYSGSGIYRHVWLTSTSPVHVSLWGTYVTTPNVSEKVSRVQVETAVSNEKQEKTMVRIISSILDKNGKKVASQVQMAKIEPNTQLKINTNLKVDGPQLWSIEHPYLYRLASEVYEGKELRDTYYTTFGIRSIQFRSDSGFFLNNK